MPPAPTHVITSRPDGKYKVTNLVKKQKQVSVDKTWQNLPTAEKLDLLAEFVGLIDSDGQIIVS